ncbi:reverse transcriptase domain-containing protein, partial [Tanacetum coccineum]
LYASLSGNTLKPTRVSIRLDNHTYQYPMGIAENMLVQIQKFIFPADFVILQMEEDDKVPIILGRLNTNDAIIRVKNKELNIGVGDDRICNTPKMGRSGIRIRERYFIITLHKT